MSQILADLNTTAMVVGYISLVGMMGVAYYLFSLWANAFKYKRRRKRRLDAEWDSIRTQWLSGNLRTAEPEQPVEYIHSRVDTDILDVNVETPLYDYQEEDLHRDAS
ncbi:MAG: hypothetical protein ACJ74Y_14175 [Bryobacteraceae bacterium]|jgi:hypothetical protein